MSENKSTQQPTHTHEKKDSKLPTIKISITEQWLAIRSQSPHKEKAHTEAPHTM